MNALIRSICVSAAVLVAIKCCGQWSLGAEATDDPYVIVQNDGSELTVRKHGNGACHWLTTEDGYALAMGSCGFYEYARLENSLLVPTGVRAKNKDLRPASEAAFLSTIGVDIIPYKLPANLPDTRKANQDFPFQGTVRVLVICMQFPDLPATYTTSVIADIFNKDGGAGAEGKYSVAQWYRIASKDKLNFIFDVKGWYTSAYPHSYYGDGNNDLWDMGGRRLAREAVMATDNDGTDFTQYDNDGDGDVDAVFIIYAGQDAQNDGDGNCIWAHNGQFSSVRVDGKTASDYACSGELEIRSNEKYPRQIGIKCHELGHSFGFGDYYSAPSFGRWSLMASSYNTIALGAEPCNFDPWHLVKAGWETPVSLRYSDQVSLSLSPTATTSNQIVKVTTMGTASQYYYLENRQNVGIDRLLPGHGLMVWYWDDAKPEYYILEADFDRESGLFAKKDKGTAADPFPGTRKVTRLGFATTPSSRFVSTGTPSGLELTSIAESGETVTITMNSSSVGVNNGISPYTVFEVFPNPASNRLFIQTPEEYRLIRIIDVSGNVLIAMYVTEKNPQIDVSRLPKGLYIISASNREKHLYQKLLIK
jgi:M6 family metalloprotease-like protein